MHDDPDARLPARAALTLVVLGIALLAVSLWVWHLERGALGTRVVELVRANRLADKSTALGELFGALGELGSAAFLAVLIAVSIVVRPERRLAQDTIVLTIGASLVCLALKLLVDRTRPDGLPYSWPSGHATAIFGWALATWRLPRVFAFALAMAVVGSCARVPQGRHWPSDVLGAYGVTCLLAPLALRARVLVPASLLAPATRRGLALIMLVWLIGSLALVSWQPVKSGYHALFASPLLLWATLRVLTTTAGSR